MCFEPQNYQNPVPAQNFNAPVQNPAGQTFSDQITIYKEKRELNRRILICMIPCIILMGIMAYFYDALIYLLRAFGMDDYSIYMLFSDTAVTYFFSFCLSTFCFGLPFFIAAKAADFNLSELVPLGKPKKGTALPYFFTGVAFCGFANILSAYADSFFNLFGVDYNMPQSSSPEGIFGFLLSVLVVSVEPGLMEEFAFRGIVQGILRRYGDGLSVLVSAVFFGAMHGNFDQIPFAFMVGLILGFIRIKTGSMWIACAVHSVNNLISVVIDYCVGASPLAVNLWYTLYLALVLLLGLIGIWMLRKKKDAFEFPENGGCGNCTLCLKERYKKIFTHPAVIIFLIICILEAVQYIS